MAAAILSGGLWGLGLLRSAPGADAPKPGAASAAKESPPAGRPAADPAGRPPDQQKRLAWLFRVGLPITGRTSESLRDPIRKAIETAEADKAKPVLIFEFASSKEEADFARQTLIGSAFDLANFLSSDTVSRARTVAYLPQPVQGHAVLAVLACDEIVMAPDAELGPASIDANASDRPAVVAAFRDIVTRRKKFLEDVAMKLADPGQELLKVETDKGGTQYVTREHLENLKKTETLVGQPVTLFPAGEPARFSGTDARHKGFIEHLANNRTDLVRALDLSEAIRPDVQVAGSYRAKRVDIKGPIHADMAGRVRRMIHEAVRDNDVNFVCLWIDSAGGDPVQSMELAKYLATDPELSTVQTVAYVPNQARADAALVALACNEIAVQPEAVLGGEGDYIFSPEDVRMVVAGLRGRDGIMARKGRSWSVPAAMFDPGLAVYRCTRGSQTACFGDEEFAAQQEDAAREGEARGWKKWEAIPKPAFGRPLWLTGDNAADYLSGVRKVHSRTELKEFYNLTSDPELLEPTWVDVLVGALASPAVGVFLLIIGGAALYAELHSPGIGVGAFVAAVCFVLFFWSHYLAGKVEWLQILLFVTGIICLLLEVFVIPGFGIFGLGGGVLIVISLILACQTFVIPRNAYQVVEFRNSLLAIAAAMVGIIAAASTINRWLPHTPFLGQLVLHPPSGAEAEAIRYSETLAHFEALVGMRGKATTPLMPGGKARFGKELLDVMTDGEFVDRDVPVEVVDVRGSWVVVRAVEDVA
jgi:membrane-bound serine protease (ClpP class)